MSQKRSFEEYHDPDYSQFQPSRSQPEPKSGAEVKTNVTANSAESRIEAIRRVIEREFEHELTHKEQELDEINKRIGDAKQLLARVRYAVVHHYYSRKSLLCSAEEIAEVQKCQQQSMTSYPLPGDKPQMAIHPAVRKLLGKRPVNYDEILKGRATRKAAQNATEQFQKLTKKPADTRLKMTETIVSEPDQVECKKPRYVAPSAPKGTIAQVNSARGRNCFRHLLVVGNVSKYIGDEEADLATSVTHKWLIYVATKTSVPVEQIVSRARFFLHESYKPNEVVEVSSPPFQISKRGWGEFPVRVQLHFHPHLMQKPIQIFHTIILDKTHTGMQTMGAETMVELWLNLANTENENVQNDSEKSCEATTSKGDLRDSRGSSPFKSLPSTSKQAMSEFHESHQNVNESFIKQELVNDELATEQIGVGDAVATQLGDQVGLGQNVQSPNIKFNQNSQTHTVQSNFIHQNAQIPLSNLNKSKNLTISNSSLHDGNTQNGQNRQLQNSTQQTPVAIKVQPTVFASASIPPSASPQLRICDQNNSSPSISNIKLPSTPPVVSNNTASPTINKPLRKFIKCVSKDGKVSLMELVQDEKNPKLFKMVLPQGVQANKVNLQATHGVSRPTAPIVLTSPNLVRPVSVSSTRLPLANMPVLPTNSSAVRAPTNIIGMRVASTIASNALPMNAVQSPFITIPAHAINVINPAGHIQSSSSNSPILSRNSSISSVSLSTSSIHSPNAMANLPKLVTNSATPSRGPTPLVSPAVTSKLIPVVNTISSPVAGIIQKNNKMLVLDQSGVVKTQQQSLLKPGVSLLKSRVPSKSFNNLTKVTVTNISGFENKNINVFVPADVKVGSNVRSKAKSGLSSQQHDYNDELEKRFLARMFGNMSEAIGWLLKEIPLVSPMAKQHDFRASFPFVVPSLDGFENLLIPKQRSFEWLRAKHIARLVVKHEFLKQLPKWSAKEIILFGRWFGYTPRSVFNLPSSSVKEAKEQNIREMVKSELIKEHLQTDVISFNTKLVNWIESVEKNRTKTHQQPLHEQIICVDEDEDDEEDKRRISPLKNNSNKMQMPIESGQNEVLWINEVCRRTQIRFEQEDIVEGVLHRSAELVFATALKSFVEDLLRKSCGRKLRTMHAESSNVEITSDDVLQTISTIPQFDFLTNKNLGFDKGNPS